MFLYLSIIIPIISFFILKYFNKINIINVVIIFISYIIVIIFCSVFFNNYLLKTEEYWGELGIETRYYEEWNEMVTRIETYQCGTSNNPQTCFRTVNELVHHPASYYIHTNIQNEYPITKNKFNELTSRWNNKTFKELNRNSYSIDGDMYFSKWPGDKNSSEPIITKHYYDNLVKISNSVYNFPNVSKQEIKNYDLFDFPKNGDNAILGYNNDNVQKEFKWINGKYGPIKKVRFWVLVFKNQPLQAAYTQEAYWKGGNKNEFIYCIGIDDNENITWSHIISWTDSQELKISARNFIVDMKKLDLMKLAEWTEQNVHLFIKKDFREFNHIEIIYPMNVIIYAWIFIILINGIVCFFIIKH